MKRVIRILTSALLVAGLLTCGTASAATQPLEQGTPVAITTPSAILVEAQTGTVIFEKNADERRPVASVTKLMTVLILFEKLQAGDITLEDPVTVSKNAASMTGSQVLLDANTTYPLATLLKGTIVASGNDAAVALAEYVAGSEENFVKLMNERAAQMGLENTLYVNCTGLPAGGQYTTARDVAAISCEVAKHPDYFTYSSIWIDTLKHPSGRVTDLTNTNRLVRFYTNCDGFKTGSTNEAKYCMSATAERNGMRLIAVVLGTSASQTRFDEARAMMDYGFATYSRVQVAQAGDLTGHAVPVTMGAKEQVPVALGSGLSMLLKAGQQNGLSFTVELPESIAAPVQAGDVLGEVTVLLEDKAIARIPAVAAQDVRLPSMFEGFVRLLEQWR